MQTSFATLLAAIRREKKRWFGTGPWRVQPFAGLLARRHPSRAWHAPESVDGEIYTMAHPALSFTPGHPLLGQTSRPFVIETGEPRFQAQGIAPTHATVFWSLGSAGVLGDGGLVYCPRHRTAVAETARTIFLPAGDHPELGYDRPVNGQLAGVALLLAGPFGHAHYHLLWDNLAKLALLPENIRASVNHYLVGAPQSPSTLEWLVAAGVPPERIVWLTGASHLLCEQVIFGTLPTAVSQPRRVLLQALHALLAVPVPATPSRWLWISRHGLAVRDLVWEDQILAALPRFERVDLAALPAREQIRIFAEAVVVAGPHGSGMANLAFVSGTGDFVEFFAEDQADNPLYARIAQLAGWRPSWARVDFKQPAALAATVAALQARLPSA